MSDAPPEPVAAGSKTQDWLLRLLGVALLLGIGLGIWSWWRLRAIPKATTISVVTSKGQAADGDGVEPAPGQVGTGAQQLAGYVVDGAGAPVAGVEVRAELEAGLLDGGRRGPVAVDAGVVAPAPRLSASTAADGRFELRGAEAGRYRVRVIGPGIFSANLPSVPIPGDDLPIVVVRKVSIVGKVTERGQPVAGATVEVTGEAIGGTVELTSGPTGEFALSVLPEGVYDVASYRNDLASPTLHLQRLGAGPFAEVELKLDTAAVVLGRVFERPVDAEGVELGAPAARVGVIAALELRPLADDEPARYAQSGADGRFRVEGVHRGRWVVSAIAPGFVTPDPVEIDAGRGVVELGVISGGSIEGRVVDSGGRPVVGATLRAVSPSSKLELSGDRDEALLAHFGGRTLVAASAWSSDLAARADPRFVPRGELGVLLGPLPLIPPVGARAARGSLIDPAELPPELASLTRPPSFAVPPSLASRWTTDEQGRFRLRGLVPGRYAVIARATGYAEGRREGVVVAPGAAARDADVVLSVGTFVIGTVRSHRGDPVSGARLLATTDASTELETVANGDGSFRLGPVTGLVQLEVTATGHAASQRRVDTGTVAGSIASEHREDFVITAYDAVLRGVVDDPRGVPIGGARVRVAQGPAQGRTATSAADGTFTLDQLPAGPLPLSIEHGEFPAFQATVEDSTRARLVLPFGGGLEGRLLDDAGNPIAGGRIAAVGPGPSSAEATTARDGTWKLTALRAGTWQLSVARVGFLTATRAVDVTSGRQRGDVTVRDLTIELARGAVAAGTVRDRRGARLAGVAVTARAPDGPTVEARSDARGEFRLRDCPTGDVEISADHEGAHASTKVFLRPGQEVLSLVLELETP